MKVSKLRAQMIVTDTLDILSPVPGVRDGFMEAIERQQCIVHPVNMPPRCPAEGAEGYAAGREMSQQGSAQRWTTVLDGERLRQLRQQQWLSQEKLADLAGISLRLPWPRSNARIVHPAEAGPWGGSPPH